MAAILCYQGCENGPFADRSSAGQVLAAESSEIGTGDTSRNPRRRNAALAWRLARGHAGTSAVAQLAAEEVYPQVSGLPSHPITRTRPDREEEYVPVPGRTQDGRRPWRYQYLGLLIPAKITLRLLWANLGRRSPGRAAHPIRSGSVHHAFPFPPKSSPVPSPIQFSKLPTFFLYSQVLSRL